MTSFDKVQLVTIDEDHDGQRIDNYLFTLLKGVPKSRVYRILRKGEVRVNKKRVKAEYKLTSQDEVRIPPIRITEKSQSIDLHKLDSVQQLESLIIHETNQYILLNKPSGMAVHGGSGLSFGVIEALRALRPKEKFLELVHRLDRDTSGCLLIAKRRSYLTYFHEQLRNKQMRKEYLAIVEGTWDNSKNRITAPLKKNQLKSGERFVSVEKDGKASETLFKCLKRLNGFSVIKAMPQTGRTHQIRVHALAAGCPLLGDAKYNSQTQAAPILKEFGLKTFLLHAQRLSFKIPDDPKIYSFEAEPPEVFNQVINKLTNR
ncbi:23S rRNA pseudouridine(955/2504/2580) synthase RluC [Aliikangiella sp. IMCC44653]